MDKFDMNVLMEKIVDVGVPFGLNLIAAFFIYIVGKWLSGFVSRFIEKLMLKNNVDQAVATFTRSIVSTAILIFTFVAVIGKMGIPTASFIAVLGAAGLAVGMALQGTLSNFAAGVMLIILKPFRIGDFIEAGSTMGTVREIRIFNTILSAPDNKKIILPNSQISGDKIINFTAIERRRVDLVFGVSYDDDLKKAKEVLLNIVKSDERVLKDPEPVVAVSELGDSCVNLVCRPWVKPENYWPVYWATVETAKEELEKAGCSIPFPQRDVHVFNESEVKI